MLQKIKISHKLIFMAAIGLLIIIGFAINTKVSGDKELRALEDIYSNNMIPLDNLRNIQLILREIDYGMVGVLSMAVSSEVAGGNLENAMSNLNDIWETTKEEFISEEISKHKNTFIQKLEDFKKLSAQLQDAYVKDDTDAVDMIHEKWLDMKSDIFRSIDEMAKLQKTFVNDFYGQRKDVVAKSNFIVLMVSFISAAFFLVLAFIITSSINKPIKTVVEAARQVAEGDLSYTVSVNNDDEMGSMASELNRMLDKLNSVFVSISHEATRISNHAKGLSSSSESLMEGTNQQRIQIDQVTAAASEMSQTVLDMAKNASEASSATEESVKSAGNGRDVVGRTVKNITELAEGVGNAAISIEELGKRSDEIGDIITVIQDIADQTNLLALNAAIEAARAGEQGRGFAVVADEVRKLAEKTAMSTKEISDKIQRIQKETEDSIVLMTQGKTLADEAVLTVSNAGDVLMQIVESSQKVMGMVQSIAAATEQQSSAAEEVSQSMETVLEVVNHTFTLSEDVKKSSEESLSVATELRSQVQRFKTKSDSKQVYIDNSDISLSDDQRKTVT